MNPGKDFDSCCAQGPNCRATGGSGRAGYEDFGGFIMRPAGGSVSSTLTFTVFILYIFDVGLTIE
jgi:hypothetical protein